MLTHISQCAVFCFLENEIILSGLHTGLESNTPVPNKREMVANADGKVSIMFRDEISLNTVFLNILYISQQSVLQYWLQRQKLFHIEFCLLTCFQQTSCIL